MDLSHFNTLDIAVFLGYCLLVISVALYVSRSKKGEEKTSADYFLAGNTLPWWAIGTSLIAANISAEQLIGMTGSGFALGLGIATYEWMAAATLIVVAKYFVPIFLEKKIYTMPQFLELRYNHQVRTIFAVFWVFLYVFVNLTSIIYLGTVAVKGVLGIEDTVQNTLIIAALVAAFSTIYTLSGGLMAVAWTDPIQVFFLVFGGLITTYLALDHLGGGHGFIAGFQELLHVAPQKFNMILNKGDIMIPVLDKEGQQLVENGSPVFKDAYMDLPGISVLVGAMWIINLNYWGCNQYITQRALAAKSLKEAQRGLAFAGYLKLLMPLIVVVPGIIAFVLDSNNDPKLVNDIVKPDQTYPTLLNSFLFPGVKGIAFAALFAAIVGAISSKTNSIATIFTMDLYKEIFNKNATEKQLVFSGRVVTVISLLIAIPMVPLLGNFDQAFQFIQEYTGFVSPGIFCIFFFGLFWKKASSKAALYVAILTLPVALLFKFLDVQGILTMPFIDRMGVIFLILSLIMYVVSSMENKDKDDEHAIKVSKSTFATDPVFNVAAIGILLILAVLYSSFW
jgi:SSS family solute:Na+ symporter